MRYSIQGGSTLGISKYPTSSAVDAALDKGVAAFTNLSNKTNEITEDNKLSTAKYPTIKAVTQYVSQVIKDDAIYDSLTMNDKYSYDISYSHLDYDYAKVYMRDHYIDSGGGCTSIRKGNFFGRNFDWNYDETAYFTIRVSKSSSTKYASIGRSSGSLPELSDSFVASGAYSELYKVLPFITADGINECGVVCSSNVVPVGDYGITTGTTPTGTKEDTLCVKMLPRYILDNFQSATEAVTYIQEHISVYAPNKTDGLKQEIHIMVADAENTYLLEFIENVLIVSDMDSEYDGRNYMTNFYLHDTTYDLDNHINFSSVSDYGNGLERYDLITDSYQSINSVQSMTELLITLYYTNTYKEATNPIWKTEFSDREYDLKVTDPIDDYTTIINAARAEYAVRTRNGVLWQTVHTTVYDILNKKMYLIEQEGSISTQRLVTYNPWDSDIESAIMNTVGKRSEVGKVITIDGVEYIVEQNAETFNDIEHNIVVGENAHAEGALTIAIGRHSHAEGYQAKTTHPYAHAEGLLTVASGNDSHAEGDSCEASGPSSHAEGSSTVASGDCGHSEGGATEASGDFSHAEGFETRATGEKSHAEGNNTTASGYQSHAEGDSTIASDGYTHAEGLRSKASALMAHAEGSDTVASGNSSHAEGIETIASGYNSHAEGYKAEAQSQGSHAQGDSTIASGDYSDAEGKGTKAQGDYSHAEGALTVAEGDYSHAEGGSCKAIGSYSHAEGQATYANADYSHSEGVGTVAGGMFQHASGKYNVTDADMAEIVGNGTGLADKSNAYTLD